MGLNPAHGIIIMVFSVAVTVNFSKVSANENSQQFVPCKPDWYFFGDKCYKILPLDSEEGLNWPSSVELCAQNGGKLASIHSSELQEYLTTHLLLNSKTNAWIGLHDRVQESNFTWIDGSIYNYTFWDDKEPSRRYGSNEEDCVEMRYNGYKDEIGRWNDESCDSLRPHICQVDKSEDIKSPDPQLCSIEDGGGWKLLNSCYHIVKEGISWEDAEKYCEEKHKGYLVSILDGSAEVYLDKIMKFSNLSKYVWIGIKMRNDSLQKWTSGWHVSNKKFIKEQTTFVDGTCAVKTNWNSWVTAPCLNKYPFICEKIKYNVPVMPRPPSDEWKCPHSKEKWLDFEGDSCYHIEIKSTKTWYEANYECGKKGGTLASFHSENETNVLHPHVLDTLERVFIGLKRNSEQKDVFEWADGTAFTYQNWNTGEPNNQNEICGELWTSTMKWNDVPCNTAKGYICRTKKVFLYPNTKNISDHVPCDPLVPKDKTCSGDITAGSVVAIVVCTLLIGFFVGVIFYHYRDYWNIYCTKYCNDGHTSNSPGSLGTISEKVIWKEQDLS